VQLDQMDRERHYHSGMVSARSVSATVYSVGDLDMYRTVDIILLPIFFGGVLLGFVLHLQRSIMGMA
jgi:hypothetical protein